jgi:hypothetical protein
VKSVFWGDFHVAPDLASANGAQSRDMPIDDHGRGKGRNRVFVAYGLQDTAQVGKAVTLWNAHDRIGCGGLFGGRRRRTNGRD